MIGSPETCDGDIWVSAFKTLSPGAPLLSWPAKAAHCFQIKTNDPPSPEQEAEDERPQTCKTMPTQAGPTLSLSLASKPITKVNLHDWSGTLQAG